MARFIHPQDPPRRHGAFTLVELLVLLATLAVLAALLLPALARTDDHGARVVCTGNFRQLGMAGIMYAGDNRDTLAYPNWDGGANGSPPGWLYWVGADAALGATIPSPYGATAPYALLSAGVGAWKTGTWYTYVNNYHTYLCPVDVESRDYLLPAAALGRQNKLSTYVMNGAVTGYPGSGYGTPCKISDAWNPACYLLWEPDENSSGLGNPGAFEYNDAANLPSASEGLGRLHSPNGGEIMSVDGAVKFVPTQAWRSQVVQPGSGPGGRTLAFWSTGAGNGH